MIRRRDILAGSACAAAGALIPVFPLAAAAETPPTLSKTARIVMGFPAGGSGDSIARLLAERIKGSYAPVVLVENRVGAGGRLAMDHVKAAEADGSALVLAPASVMVIYPHVYKRLSYDPLKDFAPVSTVCTFQFGLSVGPAVPPEVRTVQQFAQWCNANPSKASFGSPGEGTMAHFAGVVIGKAAGMNLTHVPYKGGAPLVQALMANEVSWGLLGTGDVRSFIQSGKLKAIGQLRNGRSELWPEVPTLTEQGVPGGVDFDVWFGVVAPAKTPPAVVKLLGEKIAKITAEPAFRKRLNDLGGVAPATGNTPEAFAEVLKRELAILPKAAQDAGLQLD